MMGSRHRRKKALQFPASGYENMESPPCGVQAQQARLDTLEDGMPAYDGTVYDGPFYDRPVYDETVDDLLKAVHECSMEYDSNWDNDALAHGLIDADGTPPDDFAAHSESATQKSRHHQESTDSTITDTITDTEGSQADTIAANVSLYGNDSTQALSTCQDGRNDSFQEIDALKSDYPHLPSVSDGDNDGRHAEPWSAGGVRFAPLRIPLNRRLQTAAVFWYCVAMGTCVTVFAILCTMPLLWSMLLAYLAHLKWSGWGRDGRLHLRSEWFRSLPVWRWFAAYFPVRLHKTHDLEPTKKYIFGYHPHGIVALGAWATFGTEGCGFSKQFPGITNTLLTLDSNFSTPFYRDYLLAAGVASVSKESITNILTRGGSDGHGLGRAVTVVVGGARESLQAHPGTLRLILDERKGFIKLAKRLGADLVPVLSFGENDVYKQLDPDTYPRIAAFQKGLLRWLKFTIPILRGRGVLNYDVGLMPYRRPMNVVVGKPISTGEPVKEPDQADIKALHAQYVDGLRTLWDSYKDQFAPGRETDFEIVG